MSGFIDEITEEKGGSSLQYIEWWTDEMLFWELKGKILGKVKNPHWNYGTIDMVTGEEVMGRNHFEMSQKPYIFLSVFNLGKHPYDETSLVEQNLSNQDQLNKRNRQIS